MMLLKRIPMIGRIGLCLVIVAAAVGAYQLLNVARPGFQGTVSSLDAYVCGGLTEIKTGLSGRVLLIAGEREQVGQDDLVLEIAVAEAARAKLEAEKQLQEILPGLAPPTLKILEGFFVVPEEASALAVRLEAALTETDRLSEQVAALSLAHAKSQLAARKLELKEKKIAEDQEMFRQLQAEETRLNSALELARHEYEAASDYRAALEASLRTRKLLEQAAAALRGRQKQLLDAAQSAFSRISDAERELADSRRFAPSDARVIKTYFNPGDTVEAGRVALLLEPTGEDAFWIIASFSAQDAEFVAPGVKCLIEFQNDKGLKLSGRVLERIYPDDEFLPAEEPLPASPADGKADKKPDVDKGEAYFKIRLDVSEPEMLLYLQTRPDALVTIDKNGEAQPSAG